MISTSEINLDKIHWETLSYKINSIFWIIKYIDYQTLYWMLFLQNYILFKYLILGMLQIVIFEGFFFSFLKDIWQRNETSNTVRMLDVGIGFIVEGMSPSSGGVFFTF